MGLGRAASWTGRIVAVSPLFVLSAVLLAWRRSLLVLVHLQVMPALTAIGLLGLGAPETGVTVLAVFGLVTLPGTLRRWARILVAAAAAIQLGLGFSVDLTGGVLPHWLHLMGL